MTRPENCPPPSRSEGLADPRPRGIVGRLVDFTGLSSLFEREDYRYGASCRGETPEPDIIVSPADSTIDLIATVGNEGSIEGKDSRGEKRPISLIDILKQPDEARVFRGGIYVKEYLAPWRLHHVLFPCGGTVTRCERFGGGSLPLFLMKRGDVDNERVVISLDSDYGFPVVMVMISSGFVRRINAACQVGGHYERGERLGNFGLGSCVITVFPRDTVKLVVAEKQRVRPGEPIARVDTRRAS